MATAKISLLFFPTQATHAKCQFCFGERVPLSHAALARTYLYDAAGNTLSYTGASFTYNNRGRMATATVGGVTANYAYSALGQRIKRTTSGVTTLFVYDEAGHIAGEYTAAGALIQETVWLGDK